MISKKTMRKNLEEASNYLEEVVYFTNHRPVYSVNVKRYNDYVDIDELISQNPALQPYRDQIKEDFNEEAINDIYWFWLEMEQRYLIEDFLGGCAYSKDEQEELNHLASLDQKSAGFYGRMGGHFGILPTDGDIRGEIDYLIRDIDEGERLTDSIAADYYHLKEQVEAVRWILETVDKMNKGLDFEEEVRFRISEKLDDYQALEKRKAELGIAKKYAEKHGYILARQV